MELLFDTTPKAPPWIRAYIAVHQPKFHDHQQFIIDHEQLMIIGGLLCLRKIHGYIAHRTIRYMHTLQIIRVGYYEQ